MVIVMTKLFQCIENIMKWHNFFFKTKKKMIDKKEKEKSGGKVNLTWHELCS